MLHFDIVRSGIMVRGGVIKAIPGDDGFVISGYRASLMAESLIGRPQVCV